MDERHDFGELCVRIVVGSDPVRGTAILPTGEHSEFWGWLELAEVVQSAAGPDTGGTGPQAGPGGSRGHNTAHG